MNSTIQADQLLLNIFKLKRYRPGQKEVIELLLGGKSALAVFPTGGGKSLCYQLPALIFDGLTLVVSPLIALMKDQVDALRKLGIAADRLDSSLDKNEAAELYTRLRNGTLKLLYISPERLKNERFLEKLSSIKISLLAVDEAHCISEWGHNFRPEYLTLALTAKKIGVERILALTATATPSVAQDICRQFSISQEHHIQTSFKRENLHLGVKACSDTDRTKRLLDTLERHSTKDSVIVYATLQKTAENLCATLIKNGINAGFYHAGLKDDERADIQNKFMAGEIGVVVATIAFGMGIDKSNIRAVYHFNLPKSMENYVQEIGRAGRDGETSVCVVFAVPEDLRVLENFSYGDTPSAESILQLVDFILVQEPYFHISYYELSHRFDLKSAVLSTALTYLELFEIVSADAPFYAEYKLKFLKPVDQVVQSFDPDRRDFLERLFNAGSKGRDWLTLDMLSVPTTINEQKLRIVKALEYLEGLGTIELKVGGLRHGFKKNDSSSNLGSSKDIAEKLSELFLKREQRDISRLYSVVDLINNPKCLSQQVLEYFGEASESVCGACSHCRGENLAPLCPLPEKGLTSQEIARLAEIKSQNHPALIQPRQIARFFCGLASPALARSPLKSHPDYGSFAETSFKSVLNAVESLGR